MKLIEIKGIGIPNKGAELMLHAILQHFRDRGDDVRFVVEPTSDFLARARYGLLQKSSFVVGGRPVDMSGPLALVPRKLRRQYGVIIDREIDVILDASGFAYGDQWGTQKAKVRLGKNIAKWKRQGKKVILLPQAFGPFKKPGMKEVMEEILHHADLVFARDRSSFSHLEEIAPGKAVMCPDFTNIVRLPRNETSEHLTGRTCIIPNSKMITMGRTTLDDYANALAKAVSILMSQGKDPFILIHEGKGDLEVANAVVSRLSSSIEIVSPDDALEIKHLIGKCSLVVSARFHGLVSALSQGVPVIAMGWSHKYEELLHDYGVHDLLADPNSPADLEAKIRAILQPGTYSEIASTIAANIDNQKEKVRDMWRLVDVAVSH